MFCRNRMQVSVFLISLFAFKAVAIGASSIENELKFKTQRPPQDLLLPKDCYEYMYGKLMEIRTHGSTWRSGYRECSNCTCDNGDIRCFLHFCSEPSTDYMTPPAADSVPNVKGPEDEEDLEEESSGFPPENEDQNDVKIPEKWITELSPFETSSASSASDDFSLLEGVGSKDPTENETFERSGHFCSKTCKMFCPNGFQIDPIKGCLKCSCNACPSVFCKDKCENGYAYDKEGCQTCTCFPFGLTNDDDITFGDEVLASEKDEAITKTLPEIKQDEEVLELPHFSSSFPWFQSEDGNKSQWDNDFDASLHHEEHRPGESCNKTHIRGCIDGYRKFPVGGNWSRGPCVSCLCVAPGYSECNITQCQAPVSCPAHERFIPEGKCCEICPDGYFSSRDSSRVHADGSLSDGEPGNHRWNVEDQKKTQPYLLFILLPIGVLFSVGVLLFAHMWRRYHRDKYNINSFRPEERQKLRPGLPLNNDDSSSIETIGTNLC